MNRSLLLLIYSLVVGGAGWFWLVQTPQPATPFAAILLFTALALAVDTLSFRIPSTDAHSLSGVVMLSAALALGPATAALVAAIEGVLSGALLPLFYQRPLNAQTMVARPILRGGLRAGGILSGGALVGILAVPPPDALPVLLAVLIITYTLWVQLGRVGRELVQGGRIGLITWWSGSWRLIMSVEIAPLPLALLGAAIYRELGTGMFFLAGVALIAAAATVRRASLNLQSQRRSVRELGLLNEVSRAIIRSELKVEALCELIYREAGKIVDTSSFHLGLFDGDQYTLLIRVQDRVRLPRLTVNLERSDGLIGWIRQTGKALLVEDFQQEMERLPARPRYQSERPPRSGIYVPLIAGEAVIGSISVQSYEPSAFGSNDLRLLSLIADQAAVAITRARAYNDARQRARQLQAIHEVSERITAILDMDQLLPAVVRLIREHFGYHPVHIFTCQPDDLRIQFRASTTTGPHLEQLLGLPLVLGRGVVGSAAASREPILVGDVRSDPRYIRDSAGTRSELAVPLRIGDQVIGVLDVQSDEPNDFDAADLFVMQTLADQIAIAIDSANSYAAQQEEAWTLNALLQVAENVGRAATLPDLLATVVRLPPLLVGCDRCYFLLWDREDQRFVFQSVYGLEADQRLQLIGVPMPPDSAPLLARVAARAVETGGATRIEILRHAHEHQAEWPQVLSLAGSGTLAALPIVARNSLLGALVLGYRRPDVQLEERDLSLYSGIAAQIAAALESALLAEEADEAARLEQELRVAREIQTALLPAAPPQIPGWQIDATWRSARLVGGDFFDFWPLPVSRNEDYSMHTTRLLARALGAPGSPVEVATPPSDYDSPPALGFVIADVSDKGVPAAMFMAMSRSLVRAAALDGSPPSAAMVRANRWITRDSESGMFVTLFYGVLDPVTGLIRYTSAGHNPPLLYRAADGSFEELRTPGIALGVLEEIALGEAETTMYPGDLLVCYTDGVTEAINDAEEEFGVERLRGLIAAGHAGSATVIVQTIAAAVTRHGAAPPFDDVTLVVIKYAS
ncbi:MAG: SpoIIE family protein phosphatase [Oscillochloris sp.]|nr:SpoIIE family protein phosphatase [Oscillochloris sp.]